MLFSDHDDESSYPYNVWIMYLNPAWDYTEYKKTNPEDLIGLWATID